MMRRIAVVGAALLAYLAVPPPGNAGGHDALVRAVKAPTDQLRKVDADSSFGVRFTRFRQEVGGIPVLGAGAVITDAPRRRGDLLVDRTRAGLRIPLRPRVSLLDALRSAHVAVGATSLRESARARLALLPEGGGRLVWRVLLPSLDPPASFEVLVDARTGDVVRIRDLLWLATGSALLFDPNPVERQGFRDGLQDNNDNDSLPLTSLRSPMSLPRLLDVNGCSANPFTLRGEWALARLPTNEPCAPSSDFTGVTRQDNRFEALMAYAHVDRVQDYIQGLGFTNVRADQQVLNANTGPLGVPDLDNSAFDPSTGEIMLGPGGTDDAEDADVIVHEYGHAIQDDQVPGFGESAQAGAMGEGWGDYLAATISATFGPGPGDTCIGEWDAITFPNSPECIRRTDGDPTVTQVLGPPCFGEIHCAGEAWSSALWDIRAQLGGAATDRLVIQSHFSLTAGSDFHEGSRALLAADSTLNGGANQAFIRQLLVSRGLLDAERLDDTPPEAVSLTVPGQISGALNAASDLHDVYKLTLAAGGGVVVTLTGAGDFDLRLYPPGMTSLQAVGAVASSSTFGTSTESLSFVPSTTGDFFLDVGAASGQGSYTLSVARFDSDRDGSTDDVDNCPAGSNPGQEDLDRDALGDVCDLFPQDAANDADRDRFGANADNCPTASNPGQEDRDGDGIGDVCDRFPQDRANDADGDGLGANLDNCPLRRNARQSDWDRDGRGDVCDRDARVSLTRLTIRGSLVLIRGSIRPADVRLARVRALVQRRMCRRESCRFRRFAVAKGASATGPGRFELDLRIRREGDFRIRLELDAPGYEPAKSRFVPASMG